MSEHYSQTNFSIIKPFKVTKKERQIFIIILICYIYIALFWVLKALYRESPQLPPMSSIHLDDATAAIVCQLCANTELSSPPLFVLTKLHQKNVLANILVNSRLRIANVLL